VQNADLDLNLVRHCSLGKNQNLLPAGFKMRPFSGWCQYLNLHLDPHFYEKIQYCAEIKELYVSQLIHAAGNEVIWAVKLFINVGGTSRRIVNAQMYLSCTI